jgi:myxalamid-type polyketide synthase MxaC
MPSAVALTALESLIPTDRASAVVASIDWDALLLVYEARRVRPLFAEMRSRPSTESGSTGGGKSTAAASEVSQQLNSASPDRRRDGLIAHLRSEVNSILGLDLSRDTDLDQGLFDLGMDSVTAAELKGRLERSLGVELPSTLAFNYPTIKSLANYLLREALRFDPMQIPEKEAPAVTDPLKGLSTADGLLAHPSGGLS